MPKSFSPQMRFERRAIVAIACYLLVAQAFLAALATGLSVGATRAGAATAFICHGAGTTPENPANNENPATFPCGFCVLAGSGTTLPLAPFGFAPVAGAFSRFVPPAEFGAASSPFDVRAGRSRAPPAPV